MTNSRTMLPVLLLALLALSRWPGLLPPNFSVVYALAFCAGVYLLGRMAWGLPLSLLLFTGLSVLGMKFNHSRTPVSPNADEPDQEAGTPEAEPANAVRP